MSGDKVPINGSINKDPEKKRKWLLDWLSDPSFRTDTERKAGSKYRKAGSKYRKEAAARCNEETDDEG
jgi:hypothetical protein